MKKLMIVFIVVSAWGCNSPTPSPESEPEVYRGLWRGEIALNDSILLPFNFEWITEDSVNTMIIRNGEERIEVNEITTVGDSLKIQMPVFANYFMVKKEGRRLTGYFVKPDAQNYRLSFEALKGDSARFRIREPNCCDINEKWRVQFDPNTGEQQDALAYFQQKGTHVTGTVLTETGDYRYLEGSLTGNQLRLSTFDGSNLYYFEASIEDGQKMEGRFYSGRSYMAPWIAFRDQDFELADADTLTYLKEGYDTFSFGFPDLKGDTLSLQDEQFKGKPVIVQIMGSWCPNCMDESRYLSEVYDEHHEDGLEIVGLTFERAKDRETAIKRARRMIDDLDIQYPVLLAGATREDRAGDILPMLNHVMSFPTTIYLNRDHEVVKIHTGFAGPGTPVYDEFVASNQLLINQLVDD